MRRMQRVALENGRGLPFTFFAAAFAIGAIALTREPGWLGGALSIAALALGTIWVGLALLARQSSPIPNVVVGRALPEIVAPDEHGVPFDVASLRGHPVLIKLFRGHWCPYCVAELRRWEELRSELDAFGVRMVAISTDSPEQIRAGKTRHGAQAVLLADPDLRVTRALGLENTALAVKPPGLPGLPIPTTILADASHVVRWIDQATDYQVRSAPERVRAALVEALGRPTATRSDRAD